MAVSLDDAVKVLQIVRQSSRIHNSIGEGPMIDTLLKAESDQAPPPSGQRPSNGRKSHPFDFGAVAKFRIANSHHSTCIETKKASTVGLGFEDEEDRAGAKPNDPATPMQKPKRNRLLSKVAKLLDPLCLVSFQDVLNDAIEEYWDVANGYIEVVRDKPSNGKIVGIHHLRAKNVHVVVTDGGMHYEFDGDADSLGGSKKFAPFGQTERLLKEFPNTNKDDRKTWSEVIHLRKSSALSRWYGFPDWLAAVASIELVQMMKQHQFDFFLNRGVAEFLLIVTGGKVDKEDWAAIEKMMKGHIGQGNAYKSSAINLPNPELKAEILKLGLEGKSDGGMYGEIADNNALDIVSAHRVPPLLAGILIPGKLGATNELPNALMAFQALVIGPAQQAITSILAKTLGNKSLNGGLALTADDFILRRITDEIDTGALDTVSRMRQTVPEAKAEGRNLQAGLKKSIEDLGNDEAAAQIIGQIFSAAIEALVARTQAA